MHYLYIICAIDNIPDLKFVLNNQNNVYKWQFWKLTKFKSYETFPLISINLVVRRLARKWSGRKNKFTELNNARLPLRCTLMKMNWYKLLFRIQRKRNISLYLYTSYNNDRYRVLPLSLYTLCTTESLLEWLASLLSLLCFHGGYVPGLPACDKLWL